MRDKKKQAAYVKERAKGKSIRKAARASGVPVRTAQRVESDPAVKSVMSQALERVAKRRGFKIDDKISETVIDALDATKVISANVIAPNGEGMKDANSMPKDFVDVPDYQARIKAAELAGKFRGDFVEQVEVKDVTKRKFVFGGIVG